MSIDEYCQELNVDIIIIKYMISMIHHKMVSYAKLIVNKISKAEQCFNVLTLK